jgi:hypothetical protein
MSQIKEYLEQGRQGKVYDPNQGLYMDPRTGQAFVPTFTNIANSNIQGEVEKSMAGAPGVQSVDAQPYLVGGQQYMRGAGGAMQPMGGMPGRGEQKQAPDPRDPWALAQEHMKSPAFKREIYQQMFGRDPESGFRNHQERNQFLSALKSTRNVLVDKFKWQIEQKRKDDERIAKGAMKQMSQKERMDALREAVNDAKDEYDRLGPEGWRERHGEKSPAEVGQNTFMENLRALDEWAKKYEGGGGGMPGREAESNKASTEGGSTEPYDPRADDYKVHGDVGFSGQPTPTQGPLRDNPSGAGAVSIREKMLEDGGADAVKIAYENLAAEWDSLEPQPEEGRAAWLRKRTSGKLPAEYYQKGYMENVKKTEAERMTTNRDAEEQEGFKPLFEEPMGMS